MRASPNGHGPERFVRESPSEEQAAAPNRLQLYKRARYYDPQTGEFISRDPLEYVDGMSLYRGYFVPGAVDPWGLNWAHSVVPGPNGIGDFSLGYETEIKQTMATPAGTVAGLQTWQTNDVNVVALVIDDDGGCEFVKESKQILDVNPHRAGKTSVSLTDTVGTKFDVKDFPGNIGFVLEVTKKKLGFRSNNNVKFTAGKLREGNNYEATQQQWATAQKMSGPFLTANVNYL